MTPPRLFGIPARDAPVVAVLRRGPSDWCHIGRWDVGVQPAYQPGAWLRGTIYPQRCDLSPDGRWLAYFVLTGRPAADWRAGGTYVAVSRLPWASALAAWGTDGTWTHGVRFDDDRSVWDVGEPDEGDAMPCRARYGLGWVRSVSYAVERRTGWTETPDGPAYDERDPWEIQRAPRLTMARPRPGGGATLQVTGAYAAFRSFDTRHYGDPVYRLTGGLVGDAVDRVLTGVQWADWTADGRLLVATSDGHLQVRAGGGDDVTWESDLAALAPDPQPPPPEAARW